MASCRITLSSGGTVEVQGELQAIMDELHKVATRREHTFAVLRDAGGQPIALRPDAVLHVRPAAGGEEPPPPSAPRPTA